MRQAIPAVPRADQGHKHEVATSPRTIFASVNGHAQAIVVLAGINTPSTMAR